MVVVVRDPRATGAGRGPAIRDSRRPEGHEDALDALVREWTHSRDKWAIADELQAAGIAAAPVEHLRDMLENDPQLPGHYQVVRQPEARASTSSSTAKRRAGVGHELALERAPMLGEHNVYVVQDLLGRSDTDLARWSWMRC